MVTFKPIIVTSNRHNDGCFPVKIRITYKGKSRRIPTSLVCHSYDLTRTLKIKSPDIIAKGNELCDKMRAALVDVSPFLLAEWDVDQVVRHIKQNIDGETFALDFFAFAEQFCKGKTKQTAYNYKITLSSFAKYLHADSFDINAITRGIVQDYINKADNKTISMYIVRLRTIHEAAKLKYNDEDTGDIRIPRSPFKGLEIPRYFPEGQKSLGVELMQRIISYKADDPQVRFALDAFIVSFGTMGCNLADMYDLLKPAGGYISYNRKKTKDRRADHAEMRVKVQPCLTPFVARLSGRGNHWLMRLRRYKTVASLDHVLRLALRKFCESEKIPVFTFYAARHSFATIARKNCAIEKATIDDCLCHVGDHRLADIYAEKAWELMDAANEKVLALFVWPSD